MTESRNQLAEIAALSWTAVQTPHDHLEGSIETLQRAVDITRQWLVEVESEIVSYDGTSGRYSREQGKRNDASSSKHGQRPAAGFNGRCRLFACWTAYRDRKSSSTDNNELGLLREMYLSCSARMIEATKEIARLSVADGRGADEKQSLQLTSSTSSNRSEQETQQRISPVLPAGTSDDKDAKSSKNTYPSSRRGREGSRQKTTRSTHGDTTSKRSSDPRSGDTLATREALSASNEDHKGAKYPAPLKPRTSASGGHVSTNSIHTLPPVESEGHKDEADAGSGSKPSRSKRCRRSLATGLEMSKVSTEKVRNPKTATPIPPQLRKSAAGKARSRKPTGDIEKVEGWLKSQSGSDNPLI